jgi:predicted nucleic acid-binding protein
VKAADTNVCMRLFVDDTPTMTEAVRNMIDREGLYVSKSVMLEIYWVVRSRMGFPRARAYGFLRDLIGHPAIEIEDGAIVTDAIESEDAGLEFDDALHLFSTPAHMAFATFDNQLAKRAKRALLSISVVRP